MQTECKTAIVTLFTGAKSKIRNMDVLTSLPLAADVSSVGWYVIVL
jgi:hypothetical protein